MVTDGDARPSSRMPNSLTCLGKLHAMARSKDKPPSFEQAIEQLEAIIENIESGQVGLEQSIAQYEQGMKLIKRCRSILDTAEKRIADLDTDDQGGLRIVNGQDTN